MSRSVLILLLLLVIWILFGAWFCNNKLVDANSNGDNGPCDGEWSINYKDLKVEADGFISFPKSKAVHSNTSKSINSALDATANFLKSNKSVQMTIMGYFDENETFGDKELVHLGMARANDVKTMMTKRGVSASQLKMEAMRWKDDCFRGNTLIRGASFAFGK